MSQNELLVCIKEHIQEQIVSEVKQQQEGSFYSLQADEVRDVSNWEQLGVALRYLGSDNKPVEKIIEYIACESTTGAELSKNITACLQRLTLDTQDCRAQTYDGAGCMAGHLNGCAANFMKQAPKAIFYHCASHDLNLVLTHSCKLPEIHCMLTTVKQVGLFFKYSCKKQRHLEMSIKSANASKPKEEKTKLQKVKVLCETRWVERHTNLEHFQELYEPMLDCLDAIGTNEDGIWDTKGMVEARGLHTAVLSAKLIAAFQTNLYFGGFTKALSILLQGSSQDILIAYEKIQLVVEELKKIRASVELEFSKVYPKMETMAATLGVEMSMPRICSRQTMRNNIPADSPIAYWRCSIFVPYLDHLLSEFARRFPTLSALAVKGLNLLPANVNSLSDKTEKEIETFYKDDLPSPSNFPQEVRLWKSHWQASNEENRPGNLQETLSAMERGMFPNISRIMVLLAIIPVTAATVERGNSALKRVKTELRSSMGQDRFNALLLLHIHKDIKLDFQDIIDRYARKHPRKMLFINPLA
jgi:hypothetical protein